MSPDEIVSRHRLPAPYRGLLTLLWAAPAALLWSALLLGHGPRLALLDPRLLLLLALALLPASFIWSQGIDARRHSLHLRLAIPRRVPYAQLGTWRLFETPEGRILGLYDPDGAVLVHWHAAHLSHFAELECTLRERVPSPHIPNVGRRLSQSRPPDFPT